MNEGLKILLIDDDAGFRQSVIELVGVYNDVTTVGDLAEARHAIASQHFDVVLLDLSLPDGSGMPLIREIKSENCNTVVLVITGDTDFNTTKKCIEVGADDYVVKSTKIVPDLLVRIPVAVSRNAKDRRTASLEAQLDRVFKQEMIGQSMQMMQLRESISSFASTDSSILITGESGTGKENIARRLHHIKGADRPFVGLNCGAIPENLIESHLFGHKKGAFTGANADSNGHFAQAYGGDLFLDEIGELPLQAQVKLLRVLQDRTYFKVGGDRQIEANCRVIAATNQDLEELVYQKKFRKDLYYRLNIIRIKTSPLRERSDDIRDIAKFLLVKKYGSGITLAASAITLLERHDWPGNIRELENTIVRAKHLAQARKSKIIEPVDIVLDLSLSEATKGPRCLELAFPTEEKALSPEHYSEFLAIAEREYLRSALNFCGGKAEVAANKLGIHRGTIYKKLNQLGLSRRSSSAQENTAEFQNIGGLRQVNNLDPDQVNNAC